MSVYGRDLIKESKEQIIQEAYFGKTPELLEAEKILGEWRSKYFGFSNRMMTKAMSDPLYYKFTRKMADIFGFKEYILILQGLQTINSSTLPVSYLLSYGGCEVKKTPTGYKYNGEPIMLQYIYNYLLFDKNYTDGEIMSVCLHEIGHNFSSHCSGLVNFKAAIMQVYITIALVAEAVSGAALAAAIKDFLIATSFGRALYKTFVDLQENNAAFSYLVSAFKFFKSLPMTIMMNFSAIIKPLSYLRHFLNPKNLIDLLLLPSGYMDERLADDFATIYGYGPESASVDQKMNMLGNSTVDKVMRKLPVITWMTDLLNIPLKWAAMMFDPHPTDSTRRRNTINYLEAEMAKDRIPKETRNMIKRDLMELDASMNELQKDIGKLSDGNLIYRNAQVLMSKLHRGSDPRELLANYEKDVKRFDAMGENAIMKDITFI